MSDRAFFDMASHLHDFEPFHFANVGVAVASDALKLIGNRFRPPRKDVSIQAGSPASAIELTRVSSSRKKITISILARYIPMQAWIPTPKPTWRFGFRSAMKENGRSNASSSRFADGYAIMR